MGRPLVVVVAEDSSHDVLAVKRAWALMSLGATLHVVTDGEDCLDYLRRKARWSAPGAAPKPDLLVVDLRMPRMDGLELIRTVRAEPDLATLPIVVLTTSKVERDRLESYGSGADAFVIKAMSFRDFADELRRIVEYWEIVEPR